MDYSAVREKVAKYGATKLTIEEILSFLLETDKEISLYDIYNKKYLLKGLTPLQKEKVKAIKELLEYKVNCPQRETIRTPYDVYNLFKDMQYLPEEHFRVILLNTQNEIIDIEEISVGSVNLSIVHPREVFKYAIIKSAVSIIAIHNHPGGSIMPSEEDKKITKRLLETGTIVGINLLDHVIIGNGYYSMKSNNDF